jgi:hypothetical protein
MLPTVGKTKSRTIQFLVHSDIRNLGFLKFQYQTLRVLNDFFVSNRSFTQYLVYRLSIDFHHIGNAGYI